jgi:hypothetical protein
LRSIHNCHAFYDHAQPWVTHCSVQHHTLSNMGAWIQQYNKPVVVDECGYEGDIFMMWGDLSPEELVLRFWLGFTCGGYVGHGETYMNDHDRLWWSKGGDLIGESVERIAFLRGIFEQAPRLTPILRIDPSTYESLADEFKDMSEASKVVAEGSWNFEAGGYHGKEFYLFYFGMHQPRLRYFNLPEGNFRVEVIDTWNMTLETAFENGSGRISVKLPGRKYIAIRIQKNQVGS